jgi:hypothetical protein
MVPANPLRHGVTASLGRVRTKVIIMAATVLLATAAALLLRETSTVAGTATPVSPEEVKRALMFRCGHNSDVDYASLRYGPVLPIGSYLGYMVVAITPNSKIVVCGIATTGVFQAGPYTLPPGRKVALATWGGDSLENTSFHGLGWVAPDVARVEVVISDGRTVRAQLESGMFVYAGAGKGPPPTQTTIRAFDAAGTLIDEQAY